ncbi:MAG: chemotaxis protein CheW [Syntrophorhabdaceae bacterium]|nr:chemotaxis protein CheW [Syntrophorhabdaceae bacterium]
MEMEKGQSGDGVLVSCFMLGDSSFGVDARLVQEVVKVGELTHVSNAPIDVVGIRNLRGRIVTVIDMAVALSLGKVESGSEARLLIIENRGETYGFMVDAVTGNVELDEKQVTTPPASMDPSLSSKLFGVWREKGKLLALIDTEKLFQWSDQPGQTGSK